MHETQIKRIKHKLQVVAEKDYLFHAYGAKGHNYRLGDCLSLAEIETFEHKIGVKLPDCYRAFLQNIGNGGIGWQGSSAGPDQGIVPIEYALRYPKAVNDGDTPALPLVSQAEWVAMDDKPLDACFEKSLQGTIYLSSRGCSNETVISMRGQNAGKVVYYDGDYCGVPNFDTASNFLDWYEAWLNSVCVYGGYPHPENSGITMPTSLIDQMSLYLTSPLAECQALVAMSTHNKLTNEELDHLYFATREETHRSSYPFTHLLAYHDFDQAQELVLQLFHSDNSNIVRTAADILYMHGRNASTKPWSERAIGLLETTDDNLLAHNLIACIDDTNTSHLDRMARILENPKCSFWGNWIIQKLQYAPDPNRYLAQAVTFAETCFNNEMAFLKKFDQQPLIAQYTQRLTKDPRLDWFFIIHENLEHGAFDKLLNQNNLRGHLYDSLINAEPHYRFQIGAFSKIKL